jgi:hypothetical protein
MKKFPKISNAILYVCPFLEGRRVRLDLETMERGFDSLVVWLPADWLGSRLPRVNQRPVRPAHVSWDLGRCI